MVSREEAQAAADPGDSVQPPHRSSRTRSPSSFPDTAYSVFDAIHLPPALVSQKSSRENTAKDPTLGLDSIARDGPIASSSSSSSPPTSTARKRSNGQAHKCQLCDKQFQRPSSLDTHMNTHSNVRPFACGHPGCDARFNARSNALRHRHIHGVEFVRAVDAAEREARETRSETRGDAVFMETIVGQETPASATGGNPRPASLKWMPLNQTARRYTPYELSERRREGASVSLGESSQPNTTQQTEEDLSPAAGQSAS